jgi:hypothetical protein
MVGPECGARCAIRDTGVPRARPLPVTVFGETEPVAAGRTGELGEARSLGILVYVEGGDRPSGGGIGDNGWRITGSALPARADTR